MAGITNYQVDRNKHTRGMNIFKTGRNHRKKESKSERLMNGINVWASFYRFRMDIFVKDYLGIQLKLFQVFLIYAMQNNHFFMYLASRGQGKSFLSAIYAVSRCILYPKTIVVVASGNRGQAISVLKKIEELMPNSPNLRREIIDIKTGSNNAECTFHNGSVIRVVTSNDNARSARAHVILIDEFRMVDFSVISTVLRKFLTSPRNCGYHSNPEYAHIQERNKEIYLSSCYYRSHWSWQRAITYFKAMTEGKKYFICSLPYQLAIKENLLMRDQVIDEMSESDFDPVAWDMEMQALWFGENERSYFSFDDLNTNRKQVKAFYPSEISNHVNDKKIEIKKTQGEIRLVSADIATMKGNENDATSIFCVRMIPINGGYERQVVYSETFQGGIVQDQTMRINRLKKEFDADFIVLDTQNVGVAFIDLLGQGQVDPETGEEYPPIKCINDERLAQRCVYQNAEKVIYSIRATAQLNSDIAKNMKSLLRSKKVKLLTHENDANEVLETIKGYKNLPEDVKVSFRMPYIQTTLLVNETINLEAEINDVGVVKLKEVGSARKDRYSSLSYLLYISSEIEAERNRKNVNSVSDLTKLIRIRPPKRYR